MQVAPNAVNSAAASAQPLIIKDDNIKPSPEEQSSSPNNAVVQASPAEQQPPSAQQQQEQKPQIKVEEPVCIKLPYLGSLGGKRLGAENKKERKSSATPKAASSSYAAINVGNKGRAERKSSKNVKDRDNNRPILMARGNSSKQVARRSL